MGRERREVRETVLRTKSGCWRGSFAYAGSGLVFQCLADPAGRAVPTLREGESGAGYCRAAGGVVSPPPSARSLLLLPATRPAQQEGAALSSSALEPGLAQ